MSFANKIAIYGIVLLCLLVLDGLWIGFIAKGFYNRSLAHLFAPSVNVIPIIVFYPLYVFAVCTLVVFPGLLNNPSLMGAFGMGALLGLAAYGAYDLTNHATLKDWPLAVTVLDMAWGTFVSGSVSLIGVYAGSRMVSVGL